MINVELSPIITKSFNDLSLRELYEILRARSEVFVVEQNCVYQDIDGKDTYSDHLFVLRPDGSVAGCLRVFMKENEPGTAVIGRVVTTERGCGLGGKLLHAGVLHARSIGAERIWLMAQQYAIGYYQKEGFEVTSDPFMDDGILHVEMRLDL